MVDFARMGNYFWKYNLHFIITKVTVFCTGLQQLCNTENTNIKQLVTTKCTIYLHYMYNAHRTLQVFRVCISTKWIKKQYLLSKTQQNAEFVHNPLFYHILFDFWMQEKNCMQTGHQWKTGGRRSWWTRREKKQHSPFLQKQKIPIVYKLRQQKCHHFDNGQLLVHPGASCGLQQLSSLTQTFSHWQCYRYAKGVHYNHSILYCSIHTCQATVCIVTLLLLLANREDNTCTVIGREPLPGGICKPCCRN